MMMGKGKSYDVKTIVSVMVVGTLSEAAAEELEWTIRTKLLEAGKQLAVVDFTVDATEKEKQS